MEIAEDHAHIFLGFPLRHSMTEVVLRIKGRFAGEILQGLPGVKRELWGLGRWLSCRRQDHIRRKKKGTQAIEIVLITFSQKAPLFKAELFATFEMVNQSSVPGNTIEAHRQKPKNGNSEVVVAK